MNLMPAILRGGTSTRNMAGAPSGSAEGLGPYNCVDLILVLSTGSLEDLIEAIVGAVAVDSKWDNDALNTVVGFRHT